MEKNYQEALQRIVVAKEKKSKKLSLSKLKLSRIPAALGELTLLEELDLSNNLLELMPPELYRLANLKKVNISNNLLKEKLELKGVVFN